jgi:glycosyl transferase, family 25
VCQGSTGPGRTYSKRVESCSASGVSQRCQGLEAPYGASMPLSISISSGAWIQRAAYHGGNNQDYTSPLSRQLMSFWDRFERIYVINLPSRADRRREMDLELRRVGLRVNAAPVELFPAHRPSQPGEFPSIGARGCFLSHLGVLREARNARFSSIAILEDDVSFVREFDGLVPGVARALDKADWQLFYGGYRLESTPNSSPVAEISSAQQVETSHFIAFRGQETINLAIQYLELQLTRRAGDPAGGPMHVDGSYSWFRREHPQLRTFAAFPPLASQRSSQSDVSELSGVRALPPVRSAWKLIRALQTALRVHSLRE